VVDNTVFEERRLLRRVLRNQHNGSRDGDVDVLAPSAELRRAIRDGEARFDLGTRAAYAHDSSNFREVSLGVVLPKIEDI
jgi:hypothetical protein